MKPAREPTSSRQTPCASLKKPHEYCPFTAPCGPRRKKNDRGQTSAFPSVLTGSSTIELPSDFAEFGAYPPDRALPGSPRQCSLPLACRHPPEGHQIGARKRRTPGNTILSQPYRRRVSTERSNRKGSQLAVSLEGEPGPTPAAKTLPHSYLETWFRRERAQGDIQPQTTTASSHHSPPVHITLHYILLYSYELCFLFFSPLSYALSYALPLGVPAFFCRPVLLPLFMLFLLYNSTTAASVVVLRTQPRQQDLVSQMGSESRQQGDRHV